MKSFAVTLVIGLVFCVAPPAASQRAVTAELSGVAEEEVVFDTVKLTAEGASAAGIRRLSMWIDGDLVAEVEPDSLRQNVGSSYYWDTTRYISSEQPSRNRVYEVKVRATSNSGASDETTTSVIVDNEPSIPLGLSSRVEDNQITLTWAPNPEPDILGYRVERFFGDGYVKAAVVEDPSHTEVRDPGKYSYRVIAVRHSEVTDKGVASQPSTSTTAEVAAAAGDSLAGDGRGGGASGRNRAEGRGGGAIGFGSGGFPSGAGLPKLPGLSGLPDAPAALPWGTYEKRLPYKLPQGGIPIEAAPARSIDESWKVVPPDGLRWLALGLLLLVAAGFSRYAAWRLQGQATSSKVDA